MKIHCSTKLKAAFLILVFFLNIVVGFACAIGADMGFNGAHHKDNSAHHTHKKKEKHNCCKDEVSKLTKADKETRSTSVFSFQLSFYTFLQTPAYFQHSLSALLVNIPNIYFARHIRAPAPDVRIAIQSFQI
jgi:hypothetical protein